MSVNRVHLIGRLGKDPELKFTPSGKAVCNFSIATTERWVDKDRNSQESTTWHNIVAWGKTGEVINTFVGKGQEIYLEGRISNRSYEDKDGNKKYISEVVLSSFQFIGKKDDPPANADDDLWTEPPDALKDDDEDSLPY